jgi:diguanylate cyclase (GGDEF)-like protein
MMADLENTGIDLFSSPEIVNNYSLLVDIGVITHIEALQKQLKMYKQIFSGCLDLFSGTTLEEVMNVAVQQLFEHFMPDFVYFFWKPAKHSDPIRICGYKDYKPIDEKDLGITIEDIVPFENFFIKNPKPILFEDIIKRSEMQFLSGRFQDVQPRFCIPIIGPSKIYGLTLIGPKLLAGDYTPEEMIFLRYFMAFVSQAIQNYLHYEHSLRDVKTGLFNHGFFMTRLSEEIERLKRTNESASIIMMDIDFFKHVNDKYGHLAGDFVLENIARVIRQAVRGRDIPSRFGGEEFTVLLPNADKNMAWIVAERLRTSIAEMKLNWERPLPKITVSLGVLTLNGGTDISANEVMKRVDKALYQSKENGRNCTSCYGAGFLFRLRQHAETQPQQRPYYRKEEQLKNALGIGFRPKV